MKKLEEEIKFYRKIFILAAAAYLIFAVIYRFTPELTDPMSLAERLISISVFLMVFILSYRSDWVKRRIEGISYLVSLLAIFQLIYYTYLQNFRVALAILIILITAIFNLIFNLNLLKFLTNLLLIIVMIFTLYFSDSKQIVVPIYFSSYLIITALSFYISYSIEQAQNRIEKNLEELRAQYKFQKTLADVSSRLVNLGLNNFNYKINESLKVLGEFFDIDRSYIFKVSDDKKTMSNKFEWTAPGIKSEKDKLQNLSTQKFKWWFEKLNQKELIIIENLEELDNQADPEKILLKEQNVNSLIVVPIFISDELYGFFGFDLVESEMDFNQAKINQLKIFADVITRAISKHLDNLKIKELSYYDSLTGLYNRRFFEVEMERLDSQRQLPLSIIMADLNGLKIINDSYGHKKGDQMLNKAAEVLKSSLREEDILARQGGDEFIILLPQTDQNGTAKIIQRIKKKTAAVKNLELPLSIALGQATKTNSEEDIEEIIRQADNQMYENKLSESRSSKSNIVQGLINALDAKSSETKEHAMRMTKLAFDFGEKIGLTESDQNRLSLLATLHDIGKININEEILNKEEKLTDKEWKIIKKHTEQGYKIASSSEEFAAVAEEIFSHHENWDGSGYPRNLKENSIPFLARIISLVDSFDVMTHERPYSRAMSKKEALTEIRRCAGSQFDPKLAAEFIEMLK
ncbi:HD domain-containing phosphohydrolase [Halanaerobium kushneri]|uniref:Diguanylate cyclase (GGDEF) domain-containing protein/HDIG domain-containing protein n=1 Tax=Halanaerobium kushneri TaxID=56779 RepID=A0A1N6P9E1_9FIRM|nr:HD domain-containing phosphohydrolase [Halanaerobium kushneri]SIQ00955.1 diguanylate cyclase (GGDEF) domain-containing protein/HDIG domain-containing protein [Halanaerobium kushneri]